MADPELIRRSHEARPVARLLAAQAFTRAAGAPLVRDNSVRLLRDAGENYPAWLETIHSAQHSVHFENYIIRDDDIGNRFADAFIAKAKEGVRVRVLYDWMGTNTKTSSRFWRRLAGGGVETRCFNPPRFDSPLGWMSRDHRKSICVDNRIAFVSGLCVGQEWVGYPERGIPPWRDTGVALCGPAVADVALAFAHAWAQAGPPLPEGELPDRHRIPAAGDVDLRVIASVPATAGLYRVEQLIAALAQKTLWLTDAYFVGSTSYVQALRAAALDGVDVRLLVPGLSDITLLRPLSRTGYRPLLAAGVRIFEWNGPMLHAKSAVADGRWARVGSSNLNVASWIGNWELDVAIENRKFAEEMERTYLEDLRHATEIVLDERNRIYSMTTPVRRHSSRRRGTGSAGRLTAGALRVGNTVEAAITNRRVLSPADAKTMVLGGLASLGLAAIVALWPLLLTVPFALFIAWVGVALLMKAWNLHQSPGKGTASDRSDSEPAGARPAHSLNKKEPSMRTKLIAGRPPSRRDKDLLLDLESIKLPPDSTAREAVLIGVRDENGDIYRTIDINGETNAADLIAQLRRLGYRDEAPNFQETELGYDRVLSVVKVGESRP